MKRKFHQINYNAASQDELPATAPKAAGSLLNQIHNPSKAMADRDSSMAATIKSWNTEQTSRYFMQSFLEGMGNEAMRELTSPQDPKLVPDLVIEDSREQPLTATSVVSFQQTSRSIPIFGSRAVVEIDAEEKTLIGIDANLAELPDVSPEATISPVDARLKLAEFAGVDPETIRSEESPALTWFDDDYEDRWRLAWRFHKIPVVPPETANEEETEKALDALKKVGVDIEKLHLHCCGSSSGRLEEIGSRYDYFVDAHDGSVFFYFSSSAHLDVPTPGIGIDDAGNQQDFFTLGTSTEFQLVDPIRNIETFDLQLADINSNSPLAVPTSPVSNANADFGNTNPPAVSAHSQAKRVFDFFNNVLKRNSLDDKGMKLRSIVNVFSSYKNNEPAPNWRNAAWTGDFMIYGQISDGSGNLISLSRFLDVIAHEFTHCVTETSSGLIYQKQIGALNESFSDIFGVIVNNWFPGQPQPLSTWDWEIGPGLASGGGPLRNFRDPASAGRPDHMNQFQDLPLNIDRGGVHIFSGIHNRAAFNVLAATDASGNEIFTPLEVVILYYLTLTRLTPISEFLDCRRTLLNVASTFFAARADRTDRLNTIRDAYNTVGINDPLDS